MTLNLKDLSHDKLIELIESLILEVNYLKEENKLLKEENRLLKEENRLLKEENQKLKSQLGLNSSNSSKPPSTDGFKKNQKIILSEKKLIKILEVNLIIKGIP